MRCFYLDYADRLPQIVQKPSAQFVTKGIYQKASGKLSLIPISQTLSDQLPFTLSWSHYVLLLTIKNPDERRFYEIESSQAGWSLPELKRQVASCLYERLALNRDKEGVRQFANEELLLQKLADWVREQEVVYGAGKDTSLL